MKKHLGFTLVEMAIVLVVIGIVLAGVLGTFKAQMDNSRTRETQQSLTDIREALIAFALSNGRLPCPADPTLTSTAAGAGLEDPNPVVNRCNRLNGVIPWATLGVKELDAWGGRFSYSVSDDYTADDYTSQLPWPTSPPAPFDPVKDATAKDRASRFARKLSAPSEVCSLVDPEPPAPAAPHITITTTFGLCTGQYPTTGRIDVRVAAPAASALVAQKVAAVIVSHGKNRLGSFGSGGGARLAGAVGDEAENANADTALNGILDVVFVSHLYVDDPANPGTALYDDMTEWISTANLIGKMVSAGRLP